MTARGLACALAAVVAAGLGLPAAASAAEGDYVVVLRDTADTDAVVGSLERAQGFRASQRYGAALHGFAAHLSDAQRERVLARPGGRLRRGRHARAGRPASRRSRARRRFRRACAASARPRRRRPTRPATSASPCIDTGLDLGSADLNATSGIELRHARHAGPGRQRPRHAHRRDVAGRNTGTGRRRSGARDAALRGQGPRREGERLALRTAVRHRLGHRQRRGARAPRRQHEHQRARAATTATAAARMATSCIRRSAAPSRQASPTWCPRATRASISRRSSPRHTRRS